MTTDTTSKQLRGALIIVAISFLVPVTAVASTVIINGLFTFEEFFNQIIISWQLPIITGIFWLGGPLYIRWELRKIIKMAEEDNDSRPLHNAYRRILYLYIAISVLYGGVAGIIPRLTGFDSTTSSLSLLIGVLFLGLNYMPIYIEFIKKLDRIYEIYDVRIRWKSSLSVHFKFRFTAICASISGILLMVASALILFWRYTEYPELGLDLRSIFFRLVIIGVVVIIFQSLPNLLLSNLMIEDIKSIKVFVKKIASKQLGSELKVRTRDDFGVAGREIQAMASELSGIINSISENAKYLMNASTEFNNLSSMMSDGSSSLAASAEELASSIEEMSANIALTNENAGKSAQLSSSSTEKIKLGQDSVQHTVKDIREISKKVDLVQKIANQTNLLAVNASIEASSAREHGKGFAVIAREVRELADQSKLASDQITQLAEATLNRSQELKEEIDEIASNSSNTNLMANDIANASNEQQRSSDQINSTVQSLNHSAQQLAASAQELSSSSQILSDRATYLQGIVDDFEF